MRYSRIFFRAKDFQNYLEIDKLTRLNCELFSTIFSGTLNAHHVLCSQFSTGWELNPVSPVFSPTDVRMRAMPGKLNQLPRESLNGVSRRKLGRRGPRGQGGGAEETGVPAAGVTGAPPQGHTWAPGPPAQQTYVQDPGSWKEAQEQLLRYQLTPQGQQRRLCPDLRQEGPEVQDRSRLGPHGGGWRLSQEKTASCGPAEAFCLPAVGPAAGHKQLWPSAGVAFGRQVGVFTAFLENERRRGLTCSETADGSDTHLEFSCFSLEVGDRPINACRLKQGLM